MDTTLLIIEKLSEKGWQKIDNPNPENPSVSWILHYSKNAELTLALAYPAMGDSIWLKFYDKSGDARCFQMEFGKKLTEILDKIIEIQDTIELGNYLSFYLAFSAICPTSIIALEQFGE